MIDLHCHSTVSDGALSPSEVVKLAKQNGCHLLALTDHDHTGGLFEARAAAKECGITLVNGVEISVTWRHKTLHITALNFHQDNETLQTLLKSVRSGRMERFARMAEKLEKKGIQGVFDGALALAGNPEMVSRTHLAEFLLQQGYVRNKQQAFSKFLGEGKSAYVAHEWASLTDCVQAVKAADGMAVIAHPMRYALSATARRQLFEEFKMLGGDGIEVHSGNCDKNDRLNYALLAERYQLMASCGSDFHRLNDFSGGILGACPELPSNCQPIWHAFQEIRQ